MAVCAINGVVPKADSNATPITSRRGFIKLFIFPIPPNVSSNYPQHRADHWVKEPRGRRTSHSYLLTGHAVGHLGHTEKKGVTAMETSRCARDFIIFLFLSQEVGPGSFHLEALKARTRDRFGKRR